MKLICKGLEVMTEWENPIGPRFIMGGNPPRIGFGPFKNKEEAEQAREEWETYINERRGSKDLKRGKGSRTRRLA